MREKNTYRTLLPRALTIAGSDSGAGAGIQADLKTFAALNVYGLSALTAITAQNTLGVRGVLELPPTMVEAQIEAVLEDIGADTAKTGMLASPAIIEIVAACMNRWSVPLIVDPVMRAKGGAPLLQTEAVNALRTTLLPLAEVITPNLPEAEVLTGRPVETLQEMRDAARAIHDLGPRHVVIKGGHRMTDATDIYFDGANFVQLTAAHIATRHTHGTGCTFSAAIAALLAHGLPVDQAISGAKRYTDGAIHHAQGLGQGHGPINHFWLLNDARTQALNEHIIKEDSRERTE
ncbi:MAG: bifunctional hydroxymethylpyrimidine kinase/phosphomethylpyrimidine kinase [Ktedonobacteraceae bacterium]|nr:bifunctional hydroxymethylpyrimidine kinase/phosphomethylpyrimidine kinase [Ktedonobacteraceae bacterium]